MGPGMSLRFCSTVESADSPKGDACWDAMVASFAIFWAGSGPF